MRNRVNILLFLFISGLSSYAQNLDKLERIANNQMREGNTLFQKSNYAEAEVAYKKSVATYPNNPKAIFNLGNSMMQQKRYKEAITQYDYLAKSAKSNSLRAQSFHNIGNANMGLNDFQKAVDAYKNSLRINPKDEETRYNLALAQELLKQQQEQNKDNKDDQNKDNKDNKDQDKENPDKNKDEENKDEKKNKEDDKNKKEDPKDDEKENKDGDQDKEDKPNEDKQDPKDKKGDEEQKQQQPQPGKLSPQQMKQLLEAMQNEENKTQEKMNAKRVKGKPVKTEKDW